MKPKARNQKPEKRQSFTLIELIIVIIIGTVILIPTSVVVAKSLRNTFLPEHFTIASSLLEDRLEWVGNQRFNSVTDTGPTGFSGNFSDYSYEITVNYVDSSDLNTSVDPTVTEYKRVQITILRSGFPDLSAITLVTNN